MLIFKIFRPEEWQGFSHEGRFNGSADDLRDGFIHFSTAPQLAGTLNKYYNDEMSVIIAAAENDGWGAQLKWEVSRGGASFPHLYTDLYMGDVKKVWTLYKDPAKAWDLSEIETDK